MLRVTSSDHLARDKIKAGKFENLPALQDIWQIQIESNISFIAFLLACNCCSASIVFFEHLYVLYFSNMSFICCGYSCSFKDTSFLL